MPLPADKATLLTALQQGDLDLQGQFLNGSNYTFLGNVQYGDLKLPVVYKPVEGEQPLWDFPTGTLAKREAAAYVVSEALGWDLVPPTVFRRKGSFGAGSVQLYMEHDRRYHYFKFSEADKARLKPAAAFDSLINNADRKGGHVLVDNDQHLWLIDHGICFHTDDKLRTVIWDFAGQEIPADLLADMQRLVEEIEMAAEWVGQLRALLRLSEVNGVARRARRLLESGCFPTPSSDRPYPWPPV